MTIMVPSVLTQYFWIFSWQECIELILFMIAFYRITLWLSIDKTKKLLMHFYFFWMLFLGADFFALTTIHAILLSLLPCCIMLFLFIHQHALQKNFVTPTTIKPAYTASNSWLEDIVKACIANFGKSCDVLCLIEQRSVIGSYIQSDFYIEAPIHKKLLSTIFSSTLFCPTKIIFCSNGMLKSMNGSLELYDDEYEDEYAKCRILAQKTDCVCIKSDAQARMITFIIESKELTCNAWQALEVVAAYKRSMSKKLKEKYHVFEKNNVQQQRNP